MAPTSGPAVGWQGRYSVGILKSEYDKLKTIHKKGSLNRGRFENLYEVKEGYVRYWGMCDITSRDFQIFIPSDTFYAFLNCGPTNYIKT